MSGSSFGFEQLSTEMHDDDEQTNGLYDNTGQHPYLNFGTGGELGFRSFLGLADLLPLPPIAATITPHKSGGCVGRGEELDN